jgi:ParB family chromosome partitioning protein
MGLDALIPTKVEPEFDPTAQTNSTGHRVSAEAIAEISPAQIDPNPHQPRQNFDASELAGLADSIKLHGILQPLVVTKEGSRYQLIAGERRLRAAKILGLAAVPCIVRSFDEQQKLELALIENLQRKDLNPLEMATAYAKLMGQFNLDVATIGKRVGRDRSTIANTLRLLNLPHEAKRALVEGRITEGHARTILTVPELAKQLQVLKLIQENEWTVREAEIFVKEFKEPTPVAEAKGFKRIQTTSELTEGLSEYLGAKVYTYSTAKGGKLIIEYYSDEELERINEAIRRPGQ